MTILDDPLARPAAALRDRGALSALACRATGVDARHVAHREALAEDEAIDQQSRRYQESRHQPAEVAAHHRGDRAEADIDAEQTTPEKRHNPVESMEDRKIPGLGRLFLARVGSGERLAHHDRLPSGHG